MLCAASSFAGTNILPISTKSKSGLSRFNISFRPPAACVLLWGRSAALCRLSFRPPAACVVLWGRSAASCRLSFRAPAACVVLRGRSAASRRLSFRPPAACVVLWGRSAASRRLSFRPPAACVVLWGRSAASRRLSVCRMGRRASSKTLIFHKLKPLGLMFSGKCIILQADWHCLPPFPPTQCRRATRAATA